VEKTAPPVPAVEEKAARSDRVEEATVGNLRRGLAVVAVAVDEAKEVAERAKDATNYICFLLL
jgi:hypothetical protein